MKKAAVWVLKLLKSVIFIGFGIQTVLGIVWMCRNFMSFQEFGESAVYAQSSRNFIFDEYTGVLYPVFLLLAEGVEAVIRLPYYCVLYAVQLGAAFVSAWLFLREIVFRREESKKSRTKLWCIFGSLAVVTLPAAMQCHLAVLPNSLASSFFLLELLSGFMLMRGKKESFLTMPVFWMLCTLLMPEYLVIGIVPVMFVLLYLLAAKKGIRQAGILLAGIAVAAGLSVGIQTLTGEQGYYGRVEKSPAFAAARRFAWTNLMDTYGEWPEEVRSAVDYGAVKESSFYPANMESIFGSLMEEALGREQAQEFFWELAGIGWEGNRREILHDIAWDGFGYVFSPIALQMQLTGRGYDAYSGRNYEIMRNDTPVLSRIYMDYGCWWFGAALCLTVVLQLMLWCFLGKRPVKRAVWAVLLPVISCGAAAFWYTMRGAGMMDYKLTVFINCLWSLWSFAVCCNGTEEGDNGITLAAFVEEVPEGEAE